MNPAVCHLEWMNGNYLDEQRPVFILGKPLSLHYMQVPNELLSKAPCCGRLEKMP